jgi:hypothetical protein
MTTANKQINTEAFKRLIDELAQVNLGPYNKGLSGLVEKFGVMNELLADLSTLNKEEDIQEARKRIALCRNECQEAMNGFLAQFGTTYDETAEYFNNPMNFSQGEWENLQAIRHKVEDTVESAQPSPLALSRKIKNKKNK